METIDKLFHPETKVDMDRRCEGCACFNKKDWCLLHKHATRPINYGCKNWMTQEMLDAKLKEKTAYLESEKGLRVEYMLTLMFAFISAAFQIMVRGEMILGELIGGKEWRHERKKALTDINKAIKTIYDRYTTYFEQDYKQMMSDYGREEFNGKKYDGFQRYSSYVLMVGLELIERCWHNPELIFTILDDLRKYPNDLNLFSAEFVEQFKMKNDD
jgi:hypothetical protein